MLTEDQIVHVCADVVGCDEREGKLENICVNRAVSEGGKIMS